MKTNQLSFFILFILIITGAQAQEVIQNTIKPGTHRPHLPLHLEIGANVLVIHQAFKGNYLDTTGLNPWIFDGKLTWKNIGLRGSVGAGYYISKNFIAGFKDSETFENQAFHWRGGFSYRFKLNRRFATDLGLDWVNMFYQKTRTVDSGFDIIRIIKQQELQGGGLSLATSYWITRRLGIKFEMSYYYMTGKEYSARQFVNFPELDDQIDNLELTQIRVPVGLFITFKL